MPIDREHKSVIEVIVQEIGARFKHNLYSSYLVLMDIVIIVGAVDMWIRGFTLAGSVRGFNKNDKSSLSF